MGEPTKLLAALYLASDDSSFVVIELFVTAEERKSNVNECSTSFRPGIKGIETHTRGAGPEFRHHRRRYSRGWEISRDSRRTYADDVEVSGDPWSMAIRLNQNELVPQK
jgi:hypothetical protein